MVQRDRHLGKTGRSVGGWNGESIPGTASKGAQVMSLPQAPSPEQLSQGCAQESGGSSPTYLSLQGPCKAPGGWGGRWAKNHVLEQHCRGTRGGIQTGPAPCFPGRPQPMASGREGTGVPIMGPYLVPGRGASWGCPFSAHRGISRGPHDDVITAGREKGQGPAPGCPQGYPCLHPLP